MNQKTVVIAGVIMAGLGVALGAFGAHSLKDILATTGKAGIFDLATTYQYYHSFAMLFTGLQMSVYPSRRLKVAAWIFFIGIFFFSGSLYILSLTGVTALGAITPIGGVLFILGWIFLLLGIIGK